MIKKDQFTQGSPIGHARWQSILWIAGIALIYFLVARFSLSFIFKPEGIAAIWPPAGIFLSAILLTRRNLRTYLAAALFLTDLVAEVLAGTPLVVSLVYAAALTGDALLGAWLICRFVGELPTFRQVKQVLGFLLLCIFLSNGLMSVVAALASTIFLKSSFWSSWLWWWSSDGVGSLLVTPLILSLALALRTRFAEFKKKKFVEGAVLILLTAFLSNYAFSHFLDNRWFILLLNLFIFPFLIWAALRFGVIGAATISAILAVIFLKYAIGGYFTHFGLESDLDAIILAQVYIAMASIPSLLLAAVITERKKTEAALIETKEKFRNLFNNAEVGMFRSRLDGSEILDVNEKFLAIFGRSRTETIGSTAALHWADPREREEMIRKLEIDERVNDFECGMQTKTGEVKRCLTSLRLYREQGILEGSIIDITDRKEKELIQNAIYRITETIITSESIDAFYKSIHSILGELIPADNFFIALHDPIKGLISFPYYVDQFDEPPAGPTPIQGLTGYVIRTGRPLLATREVFDRLIRENEVEAVGTMSEDWIGAPLKVEGRIIGVVAVQSYTQRIYFDQEDLNLLEFVSNQVAQAIERKRMEEEILNLSLTDELTGLYNRRGFTLLAEQEMKLAQRFKRNVFLLFSDVDKLKVINDTFGHAHGDQALREVAYILKETFREADIPARFGGDEFVVLAPDSSCDNLDFLVNRLQATVEAHNRQGDRPYQLSLSTGIACFNPEAPCVLEELIAQADGLMYQQKQARKGKK